MTPREHYLEAERLSKLAHDKMHNSRPLQEITLTLESAKIEALLAQCPWAYSQPPEPELWGGEEIVL